MDKQPKLIDAKWREVPFEIMLKCDGEIKCDCWLLNNGINKYGVDLRQPIMFNDFLRLIGTHLTSMNCKSLFGQAKWYVIDDGVQPDFFLARVSDPIPPTIKRGDKVNHHLYDEGTVKVYDLYGDGRALVEFDDPECGERLVERNKLEVIPNE